MNKEDYCNQDARAITVDYNDTVEDTRTELGKEIGFIRHTHVNPLCIERI